MSTRVLFCCWPFEGHVFPQMAIAQAIRERGGEVAFYTGAEHQATIEAAGIPVFPFSRVQARWQQVRADEERAGGRRKSIRVEQRAFREWLVETIPDQVSDLRSVSAEFGPEAIVADASMWGPSLILRESQGIPVALASPLIYASIPGRDAPPPGSGMGPPYTRTAALACRAVESVIGLGAWPMRRRISELRTAAGLGPLRGGVNDALGALDLYLVLSIPELDFNRWDLPPGVRYVGSCLWHPPRPAAEDAWLGEIDASRPWVHVTEGTSHFQDPFVLRAAVTGMAGAAYEVIVSHGRERGKEAPGLSPDQSAQGASSNVHLTRWVNHDTLLPRCAAMVTTGGAGSVMAGIRAGVPLVIVPTTWDKPDNARRIAEAGAGIMLRPRQCTPEGLRAAVERVLHDTSYRSAAQRYAKALQEAPGPHGAAELIEGIAHGGREPIGEFQAR